MIAIRHRGEELTDEELMEIYSKLHLTNHARERLESRNPVDLKSLFENPLIAYFNTDGSVNVAYDVYNYLVVKYDEQNDHWVALTWKEKSWNNKTVFDKQNMAKCGYGRKE